MSAIAAIVINDGKTTPVAHTFTPVSSNPDANYREAVAGTPVVGQPSILLSLKLASGSEGINNAGVTMLLPVLENVTGGTSSGYVAAPRVAYYITNKNNFLLPNRSDAATRKDARVMSSNLLLNAQVVDLIDNLIKPY